MSERNDTLEQRLAALEDENEEIRAEQVPPPEPPEGGQPSEREVEADGGIYDPTDEFSDG